jgi:hypothetical protein
MIEQQLRDSLRAAVVDEPPLGLDPDHVADDARRSLQRRRAVLAATAGTVLVVGAIAGTASLTGWPSPQQQNTPAGPATVTTTISTLPPAPPAQDPLGLEPKADQLAAHLTRVLPDVVPGVRNVAVAFQGQESHGDYSLGNWLNIQLAYDDPNGRTVLTLEVFGPGKRIQIPPCAGPSAGRCTPVVHHDGSTVYFHESELGEPGHRVRTAYHEHAGSTATVTTYNYDLTGTNPTVRDTFALTDQQLVRLATDPAIALP